jgi:CrcB protein
MAAIVPRVKPLRTAGRATAAASYHRDRRATHVAGGRMKIAWIALGGGGGAVLRWLLASAAQQRAGGDLPWGTLLVNVLGCAAIGALASWLATPEREELRLLLIVGLLGGFTTMSAFAWETVSLIEAGHAGRALLYVLLSNTLCLGAAFGGLLAARAARG